MSTIINNKACCFAGHSSKWRSVGIDKILLDTIEDLIKQGYNIFYDGDMGEFDKKCAQCVIKLKHNYPQIKLIKVLTYYHYKIDKWKLPTCYDDSILPEIEEIHYKQKIIKRNQWIVDNSNILVCHISYSQNSGAYKTVQYAKKIGIPIISL